MHGVEYQGRCMLRITLFLGRSRLSVALFWIYCEELEHFTTFISLKCRYASRQVAVQRPPHGIACYKESESGGSSSKVLERSAQQSSAESPSTSGRKVLGPQEVHLMAIPVNCLKRPYSGPEQCLLPCRKSPLFGRSTGIHLQSLKT